jgi:hypothetical protein
MLMIGGLNELEKKLEEMVGLVLDIFHYNIDIQVQNRIVNKRKGRSTCYMALS